MMCSWPRTLLFPSLALGISLLIGSADDLRAGEASPDKPSASAADQKTIDRLVTQLGSDVYAKREDAVWQLSLIGQPALPALRQALTSKDLEVVYRARDCIQAIETVPPLIDRFNYPKKYDRWDVAHDLEEAGVGAVPYLLEVAKGKDANARCAAIWVLRLHGQCAKVAAPVLLEALRDEDAEVRRSAANILGVMRGEREKVVPALIRALEDKDNDVKIRAFHSLGRLGAEAKLAVPALVRHLESQDVRIAQWAAMALGEIGAVDDSVVPALTKAAKRPNPVGGTAACALETIQRKR